MRNLWVMVFSILFLAGAAASGEHVVVGNISDDVQVTVEESNSYRTVVRFEIGAYNQNAVDINGETFYDVNCGREGILLNEGEPALPRLCRSIIIPDDTRMALKVVAAEYVDIPNTPVVPSKGSLPRTINPEDVPYTFGDVYSGSEWYPTELAAIREPYIMRDYRATVIELNGFQYQPSSKTLRVYTSVTVEVTADGPGEINVLERGKNAGKLVPEFEKTYQRRFINYAFQQGKYNLVEDHGDMLIITYDGFHDAMLPLVDWKLQKGIRTTIVDVSTIGNTSSAIDAYIQNFYDDPATNLAWVLLVGDAAQVSPGGSGSSDPSYSKVAGGDNYPDIFVGRFSAQSVADVETQVERTLTYEMNPPGTDWFHKGTGVASNQGPGHHGEYDYEHSNLMREDLLAFTYTEVDQIYDPGASAATVANALNSGRSYLNYTGHGSTTSWSSSNFSNSNVNQLTNDNMLPFVFSVACYNGNFISTTCFGEAWLRATHNGNPTGAIATYMSVISQDWNPPMDAQDEAVDLLVAEDIMTIGGLCFNSSCFMMDLNGSGGVTEFNAWTIFGDPSITIRTDTPAELTVNHDPVALFTLTEYDVEVVGVEDALCAVYANGVLYGSAYTDVNGMASIPLAEALPIGESITLTVTAFNAQPYVAEIPVITPSGPYVVYGDYLSVNDAPGNGNGLADAGEEILMGVRLINVGPDDGININATVSTTDPYVTVVDSTENYGTIPADFGTGYVADGFSFEIAGDIPDYHRVAFDLEITGTGRETWTGGFDLVVHAPYLGVESVLIDDASGNDNEVVDPGETAQLVLTLGNSGSGQNYAVEALLTQTDPYITITDDHGTFGFIDSLTGLADNAGDVFEIVADAACPVGYTVTLSLEVTTQSGYSTDLTFDIIVGDRAIVFFDDFSTDLGWGELGGSADWEIGPLAGLGGDPEEDHSPSEDNRVLGNDLSSDGRYGNNIAETDYITSPVIDCGNMSGVIMSYYHQLGVQGQPYDKATLEVFDGSAWSSLYENPTQVVQEDGWVHEEYDLTMVADYNPSFQIRFGLGPTNAVGGYAGWNIDDIEVKGYGTVGPPHLELAQSGLSDSMQAGGQKQDYIRIRNTGDGTLSIRFTSSSEFLDFSSEPQVIYQHDSLDFAVKVDASDLGCGDHYASIGYVSNDRELSSGTLPVHVHIYSPEVYIAEAEIAQVLQIGEESTYPLVITNNGPGRLDYTVGCQMLPTGKGGTRTGGPDEFGHLWISSDDPGGPAVEWVDIAAVGTEVTLEDNSYAGPFSIGFGFPFYDSLYTEFYVGSNGILTFDAGSDRADNCNLPNTGFNGSLIAMWWDDLDISLGGHVYYYHDVANDRLVLSFVGVPISLHPDGTGTLSFQAVLMPNGVISLNYNVMYSGTATLQSGTVGLQNSEASDGLSVVYNDQFMHSQLSVLISAAHWLTADPVSGSVDPYAQTTVDLMFDATDLERGDYTGSVVVSSNDPANPSWGTPVTLTVANGCCVGITGNVDCDGAQSIDMGDLTILIDHLFISLAPLCCEAEANVDVSGGVDMGDLTKLIDHLFISLESLPACP